MPDYLRLFALFGIVVVNVQFFAFSIDAASGGAATNGQTDVFVKWLVEGLATLKSYGLFSFMFGVGLGFLMQSADRRGLEFGPLYRRRMIGLLILGILHGTTFFYGDILVIYAVMGSFLYLMRGWAVGRLVRFGAFFLGLGVLVAAVLSLGDEGIPKDFLNYELSVLSEGGFFDVFIFRSIAFGIVFVLGFFFQGITALGWFCLGLAAVKSGIIDNSDHVVWRRARQFALAPGLALSLYAGWLIATGGSILGSVIQVIAAPVATFGYLGLIALIATSPGPLMQTMLKSGGSSLTIYLGQSIVLSFIFAPYGLGLWSQLSYSAAVLIAIGITLALICGVTLWRRRFRLGPFEAIFRRFTYGAPAA
ncbi:MAG: DUF418 domain-containing protein [Pseudomonadota bacterium]